MSAGKPKERFLLTDHFAAEVDLMARVNQLVRIPVQFSVAPCEGGWELSYPDTKETRS